MVLLTGTVLVKKSEAGCPSRLGTSRGHSRAAREGGVGAAGWWEHTYRGHASEPLHGRREKDA